MNNSEIYQKYILQRFPVEHLKMQLRDRSYCKYRFTVVLKVTNFIRNNRSSYPEVFYKKGVLKYFAKLTGKHLIKLQDKASTLLKKDSGTGAFLWILQNFSENLLLQNTSGDCFLKMVIMKLLINSFLSIVTNFQLISIRLRIIFPEVFLAEWLPHKNFSAPEAATGGVL